MMEQVVVFPFVPVTPITVMYCAGFPDIYSAYIHLASFQKRYINVSLKKLFKDIGISAMKNKSNVLNYHTYYAFLY
jgi:hypothetical protein